MASAQLSQSLTQANEDALESMRQLQIKAQCRRSAEVLSHAVMSKAANAAGYSAEAPFPLERPSTMHHSKRLCSVSNGRVMFSNPELAKRIITCEFLINNTLKKKIVFKIKSTSSRLFTVSEPRGFVAAGASATVQLGFRGSFVPTDLRHYFEFCAVVVDELNGPIRVYNAREILDAKRGHEDVTRRLYVRYANGEASHPSTGTITIADPTKVEPSSAGCV